MGAALTIRDELTPEALRRHARHEPNRRAALRAHAGDRRRPGGHEPGRGRQARRHGAPGPARRRGPLQRRGARRPPRPAQARPAAAAERGGAGGLGRARLHRPRSGAGRRRRLDAGRPGRPARGALRQAVPPVQPLAGAEAPRPVAAEGPARAPRGGPEGPGAVQKKGLRDALRAAAAAMGLFLAEFAARLPEGVHAALVLDRAGWHVSRQLAVPANVTLVPLPPYSPELVWGFACQALIAAAPPIGLLGDGPAAVARGRRLGGTRPQRAGHPP